MLIHKSFRYRIYPNEQQIARMTAWNDALRFLWNLAHEQRLMGLCRTNERYPTAFDQINELTELRAELPWLADVPRGVGDQTLIRLGIAWRKFFRKTANRPKWKRKYGRLNLVSPPNAWRLVGTSVRFPKVGQIRTKMHLPLEGKPKTCTITRDVDQWFAIIVCEVEINPTPRTEPVVGIDRGVTNLLADSDGRIVVNPKHLERSAKRLARARRAVARRKKGSKNREKAKLRVAKIYRKVRRQREHVLHVESSRYAKSHGVIVIEDLKIANMTRSAAGTVEAPGKRVAQKRGLNRSILAAGWGRFAEMLAYKTAWNGSTLVKVPAAYTSQTCAACGTVDAASRSGERFVCTACGHSDHADVNASKNIKTRVNRSGLPGEDTPQGARRTRKEKQ